jgi:epoxyqueuosine reductase
MKDKIKQKASEIGFALVGITTARQLDEEAYLKNAIAEGRIASMNWLSRDPIKRCDPSSLLPGARSVICCALAYGKNGLTAIDSHLLCKEGAGEADKSNLVYPAKKLRARFARGLDYHDIVRQKLEELWNTIKQHAPNARAKFCVDTSPILEKALAARAGLGWIGKHTILLNEKLGSWFVLGEIITDIEILPDEPVLDLCADCDQCINACPTNALKAPRTLDAKLCVSYHTIEHKGKMPLHIQRFISDNSYGCDICQEACPYNINK